MCLYALPRAELFSADSDHVRFNRATRKNTEKNRPGFMRDRSESVRPPGPAATD